MPEQSADHPANLAQPVLLSPTRAQVVDGSAVPFAWERVEAADGYRLEVARSAAFEQVVESIHVDDPGITLSDTFPTDASLFYWRVLARVSGEWVGHDVIESFTSGTAAQTAEVAGAEEGGRGEELPFVTTQDPEHHDHQLEITGFEDEGIKAGSVLMVVGVIAVLILVAIVTIFQIATRSISDAKVSQVAFTGYPELRAARAESSRLLTQYQVTDAAEIGAMTAPTYRIPVDVAMRMIATETREANADSVALPMYSSELPLIPRQRSR